MRARCGSAAPRKCTTGTVAARAAAVATAAVVATTRHRRAPTLQRRPRWRHPQWRGPAEAQAG
eukprot:484758-Alexandrium_andersonii.AAC.1